MSDLDSFHELSYYTLAHTDPAFLHQHAVDAFTAQNADDSTRPIALVFALVGLYLHVEHSCTGRQVQQAHIQLARSRRDWQRPTLISNRGSITIVDVLARPPGPSRDEMILTWAVGVWSAWSPAHAQIAALAATELDVGSIKTAASPLGIIE